MLSYTQWRDILNLNSCDGATFDWRGYLRCSPTNCSIAELHLAHTVFRIMKFCMSTDCVSPLCDWDVGSNSDQNFQNKLTTIVVCDWGVARAFRREQKNLEVLFQSVFFFWARWSVGIEKTQITCKKPSWNFACKIFTYLIINCTYLKDYGFAVAWNPPQATQKQMRTAFSLSPRYAAVK